MFHRLLQLRFIGLRAAQQDIGAQGLRRQVRVLPDPAQLLPPVLCGQVTQFDAVDGQRSTVGQEAEQQIEQRTFAGAAQPDQRHALLRLQGETQRPGQQHAVRRQNFQFVRL